MFTSVDKALVAVVMGALFIWNTFVPTHVIGLDPNTVSTFIGALTPVLVYLVPNKPAA